MRRSAARVYVLDSFALLSCLQNGAGAERVEAILRQGKAGQAELWLSIINYGEVLYVTEREQGLEAAHEAAAAIDRLPIQVEQAGRKLTFSAAHIKATLPLAHADAFALALALEVGGRVVTGDPEFRKAEPLVAVEWLPR